MADTENKEVARITFVFETICSVNCELYFMVVCFPFFACDGVPRKAIGRAGISLLVVISQGRGPDCPSGASPFNMGLANCDGPQDGNGMSGLFPSSHPAIVPSSLVCLGFRE